MVPGFRFGFPPRVRKCPHGLLARDTRFAHVLSKPRKRLHDGWSRSVIKTKHMPTPNRCQARIYLLLTACLSAVAQQPSVARPAAPEVRTEELRWLGALEERFANVQDPVLMVDAKSKLASLVCSLDKGIATKQFRETFIVLRSLPDDAFDRSPVVLAADSFGSLWNAVTTAAKNCNPEAPWYDERLERRAEAEWQKANLWVSEAGKMANRNPERAAQLARGALLVSGNRSEQDALVRLLVVDGLENARLGHTAVGLSGVHYLDLFSFAKMLVKLRVSAPDLADGLFQSALGRLMGPNRPRPAELGALAAYLFPTEQSVETTDYLRSALAALGARLESPDRPAMPNYLAAKWDGDLGVSREFIEHAIRALQDFQSVQQDPDGAFAFAWQMLPKTRELAPEHTSELETALSAVEQLVGPAAVQIRAKFGPVPNLRRPEYGSADADVAAVEEARLSYGAANYGSAINRLSGVSASQRAQLETVIEFSEAASALRAANAEETLEWALHHASGAKRSLLYAAIARSSSNAGLAHKAVTLGLEDAAPLPADQQVCILPALASAALAHVPEEALGILRLTVAADNAAAAALAKAGTAMPDSFAAGIRCRVTGPVELVNVHGHKLAFPLRPPSLDAFALEAFLERAQAVGFDKLESAVLELRDESQLVNALLALAKLRVRAALRLTAWQGLGGAPQFSSR